jgi:hypothetical protein
VTRQQPHAGVVPDQLPCIVYSVFVSLLLLFIIIIYYYYLRIQLIWRQGAHTAFYRLQYIRTFYKKQYVVSSVGTDDAGGRRSRK